MLFHALVMSTVVCVVLAGSLALALARMVRRQPGMGRGELSPVCRQHFDLFQGEPLDEQPAQIAEP